MAFFDPESERGFTLIEVLLAITLLAAGALLALPSLRQSGDYLQHLYRRCDAETVLDNLLAEAELQFRDEGHLRNLVLEGERTGGSTPMRYRIEAHPINAGESLMELVVQVNWLGEGTSGLTRSAYVSN